MTHFCILLHGILRMGWKRWFLLRLQIALYYKLIFCIIKWHIPRTAASVMVSEVNLYIECFKLYTDTIMEIFNKEKVIKQWTVSILIDIVNMWQRIGAYYFDINNKVKWNANIKMLNTFRLFLADLLAAL